MNRSITFAAGFVTEALSYYELLILYLQDIYGYAIAFAVIRLGIVEFLLSLHRPKWTKVHFAALNGPQRTARPIPLILGE